MGYTKQEECLRCSVFLPSVNRVERADDTWTAEADMEATSESKQARETIM